jgi:hypothetical protein
LATLGIYLDDDLNPLNTNHRLLKEITLPGNGVGGSYMSHQTISVPLVAENAPLGQHALFAKITGGGRSRFLYAPEILSVLAPPQIVPLLSGEKRGTNFVLHWPTNAAGFRLECSTNLGSGRWSDANPLPVIVDGQNSVTNDLTNPFRVYRLKK